MLSIAFGLGYEAWLLDMAMKGLVCGLWLALYLLLDSLMPSMPTQERCWDCIVRPSLIVIHQAIRNYSDWWSTITKHKLKHNLHLHSCTFAISSKEQWNVKYESVLSYSRQMRMMVAGVGPEDSQCAEWPHLAHARPRPSSESEARLAEGPWHNPGPPHRTPGPGPGIGTVRGGHWHRTFLHGAWGHNCPHI